MHGGDAPIDPNIVQMYAEKKAQSAATFLALLHETEARLKVTKRALSAPRVLLQSC